MKGAIVRNAMTAAALAIACSAWAAQRAETGLMPLPADRALNAQELRGEGLFLQRCSLCHLPKRAKVCCQPPLGPLLYGVLKQDDPGRERLVREQIQRGSSNMPGFGAGLDAGELDDLISYLKTF